MKILLIEDDKDYAETLTDIFSENHDHDLLWVESFKETEGAFENKNWDIILSDVHLDFLPERIIELHKSSNLNRDTPLIFLTAERETQLAFELIEKGDFPVVSKFEIDEEILSVVRNYTDLFELISKQEGEVEQVSFQKFIARYINERRYENNEFSNSLSGWIDQEKFIFSKLRAKKRLPKKEIEDTHLSSFRAGYVRVDANDFKIKVYSPAVELLAENNEIKGVPLNLLFNQIVDTEKLYGVLNRVIEQDKDERAHITLPALGSQGTVHYDIFIKKRENDLGKEKELAIELIQNSDRGVEKAEYFNLKETNKLLMQEIHHRVNNNLNVITSLLNLRLMNAESNEREVYQTVLEQIIPITSVYEQLFSTKKISSVKLKDYIENLNRKIFSNGQHSGKISGVHFEDENLRLNLNQVISVGLLLNEMYQKYKERNLNVKLFVRKQYDVINLVFQSESISSIIDENDSLSNQQDEFILNALLNKLGALISVRGKDEIVIRFKKVTKRGGGSNLSD